ncbi:MAG: TIGR03943 family protein [Bacilli bacterium]|nr:TIGR03943 family protein [Bacilli bacterium]
MKRFLGFICLLYAGIIIYVKLSNKLNNYLAPNMQMYILLSIIPLIIMGLVMLLNNKINYKFKISDLILLLPIVMLIISGDGRLSMSLANNRSISYKTPKKTEKVEEKVIIEEDEDNEEYDFSKVDFDIKDESYTMLVDYLTYGDNNNKYIGKTVRIRGFTVMKNNFIPNSYFAIGKYAVSCCAADASFIGLISKYDKPIKDNTWYEMEGVLKKGKDKEGIDILYVKVINIKEIKQEEQYVYPCYVYGDNKCIEVSKYNLGN